MHPNARNSTGSPPMAFGLCIMLVIVPWLTGCSTESLERVAHTIEQRTRGAVEVIRDDSFAPQRSDHHRDFSSVLSPHFSVVGTRDLMMRDHQLIGPIYHEINIYFNRDEALIPEGCRRTSSRLRHEVSGSSKHLIVLRNDRCHYLVLMEYIDNPLDDTPRRLMTLYDVVEATPAGSGSSSAP